MANSFIYILRYFQLVIAFPALIMVGCSSSEAQPQRVEHSLNPPSVQNGRVSQNTPAPVTAEYPLISTHQLERVVLYETSYADVVKMLGRPLAIGDNGKTLLIYKLAPEGYRAFVAISGNNPAGYVSYIHVSRNVSTDFGSIELAQLHQIHNGMRFNEVIALLGPPKQHSGSGIEILTYHLIGGADIGIGLTGANSESEVIWVPMDEKN